MKSAGRHRVLLIDDHPIVLAGLKSAMAPHADLEVCGTASNAGDALASAAALQPDAAIVDIGLGGVTGLDLVQEIKLRHSRIRLLCLSVHEEEFFAERALRAGAHGYLMKTADAATVLRAVRSVLNGQIFLSDAMARRMLNRFAGDPLEQDGSPISRLSNRELQVVHHIGATRDNRQIAQLMNVSVKTIEAHRSKIKEKLSLRTTSDLIRFATHWIEQESSFSNWRQPQPARTTDRNPLS